MGPLAGLVAIELAARGSAPFCGQLLADMGAEVICVDRPAHAARNTAHEVMRRGKRSISIDLTNAAGREVLLRLASGADVVLEGFRPGVAERLGVGPSECMRRNRALVYGRVSGWGREGPLANAPGFDINFIALSGALDAIGAANGPPTIPLNLIGDYAGGGLLLAFGILSALFERSASGQGQVVDTAMIDGVAALMGPFFQHLASGRWWAKRGEGEFGGESPFYSVYETLDGKYLSIAAVEPPFLAALVKKLQMPAKEFAQPANRAGWPALRARLTTCFKAKTLAEWSALLEGTDVCFAPVLSLTEAPAHPQHRANGTFIGTGAPTQSRPAPRFSRTVPPEPAAPHAIGADTGQVLLQAGFSADEISLLRRQGAIR